MKISLEKVKRPITKIGKTLWSNLLLIFLIFLLLDFVLGFMLFQKYYLNPINESSNVVPTLNINKSLMEKTASDFSEREDKFNKALDKSYQDPFLSYGTTETPSESIEGGESNQSNGSQQEENSQDQSGPSASDLEQLQQLLELQEQQNNSQ